MTITATQFDFLKSFLQKHSGYVLEQGKEYVLESRLPGILQTAQCPDLASLIDALQGRAQGPEAEALVQGMTINETMFFRDQSPFANITNHILPALTRDQPPRRLSFWCAACSSGQEPYSLAMTLDAARTDYPGWGFQIFASDISEEMIARARNGLYSDFETGRGLDQALRDRYFTPEGNQWRVRDSISAMVDFAPMNLMHIPANIGPFDVILCRNVLIYFDVEQKKSVIANLRKTSRHPGYLIPGASEILTDLTDDYEAHPEWKAVYLTR